MDYTYEQRREVSLEWAQQMFEYHQAEMDTLDKATTDGAYMELIEFNVETAWDYLESMRRRPGMRLRKKDTDILLQFKGVGRSTGYPAKDNKYYWTKKGQPKLWKLRWRVKMLNISRWERDCLFPIAYDGHNEERLVLQTRRQGW